MRRPGRSHEAPTVPAAPCSATRVTVPVRNIEKEMRRDFGMFGDRLYLAIFYVWRDYSWREELFHVQINIFLRSKYWSKEWFVVGRSMTHTNPGGTL